MSIAAASHCRLVLYLTGFVVVLFEYTQKVTRYGTNVHYDQA